MRGSGRVGRDMVDRINVVRYAVADREDAQWVVGVREKRQTGRKSRARFALTRLAYAQSAEKGDGRVMKYLEQ